MKIISFKVSKYKSIYDEVSAECFNGVTVIGKNNSGKTNVLQALKLFFCGRENPELYSYETDFPSDLKSGKTSISIKFSFNHMSWQMYQNILRTILSQMMIITRMEKNWKFRSRR